MSTPEAPTLEYKIECALRKVLIDGGVKAAEVVTGENAEERPVPCFECKCPGGPEDPPGTGNYLLDFEVCVISNTDKTQTNSDPMVLHRRRVKRARDILWNNNQSEDGYEFLHAKLTAAVPDLTVFEEIQNLGIRDEIADRKISTSIQFKGLACDRRISDAELLPEPETITPLLTQLTYPKTLNPGEIVSTARWLLGCDPYNGPGVCPCANPSDQNYLLYGESGRTYYLKLRIRGVMELKEYIGGSNDGAYFQNGGQPPIGNTFNKYILQTQSPAGTFYLNKGPEANPNTTLIDYTCTLVIRGMTQLKLSGDAVDALTQANSTNLIVPDLDGINQPFRGTFYQIDVVSISDKL